MEKAESYRKILKVMCVFLIVYDLVMIALFSIVAAGLFDYDTAALLLGLPQDMLGGVSLASVMQTLGVMMITSQVIHLIGVLFVLHGVKNPAKMKPVRFCTASFRCSRFSVCSAILLAVRFPA